MFIRQTSSRLRLSSAAAALCLAVAAAAPAALAAGNDSANSVQMPAPGYQTAAAKTPAERCKVFERHFDAAVATREDSPRIDEARVLRIEGGKLCGAGEYTRGSHKLREALDRIDLDIPF